MRFNKSNKRNVSSLLKGFLKSEKVGRATRGDLKKLKRDLEESHGQSELSNCCKTKGVISEDNDTPRLSDWSTTRLSESQVSYAASDVNASLEIFNILQHVTADGTQIFENPNGFVSIHVKGSKQACALGYTISSTSKAVNMKNKAAFKITKVSIPGITVIDSFEKSLVDFSDTPFEAVIDLDHHPLGVHQNIIRKFASFNAGPALTDCALADYRLRHNMTVGSKNRYGVAHKTHFSPRINQAINFLRAELGQKILHSYCDPLGNSFLLVSSSETFGICRIPEPLLEAYDMKNNTREFDNGNLHRSLSVKEKIVLCVSATTQCTNKSKSIFGGLQHQYLCYIQGTSYAVTPIHTDEEVHLYEKQSVSR
ncbi:uncharacterized protein EV154DRAFT_325273 [Mucor mucedo]|uniref:uncharacterized protein n=1 Tax=Mucor mucedo TaxID=29922 RepID=UPI0022204416|nr:uncharacterized protein EV154DRAFT_325273 [Mucor mucedo]KAI7887971.1 hypothetical protein EV154DRAFT_325273 [Mucor mucedo]